MLKNIQNTTVYPVTTGRGRAMKLTASFLNGKPGVINYDDPKVLITSLPDPTLKAQFDKHSHS